MDKQKVLNDIFNDDPLGLLKVKLKTTSVTSADDQLVSKFKEINSFVEKENREPAPNPKNVFEFQLHSRLKSLRKDDEKVDILKPYDTFNLLPERTIIYDGAAEPDEEYSIKENPVKITSIDDILGNDSLDILGGDAEGLFEFKHTPKDYQRANADFVARRKKCKDFDKYDPIFKQIHQDLVQGKRKLIPFKQENLRVGDYYVHNGMLLFLESVDFEEEELNYSSGKRIRKDGRTRTIFENGTESRMLYRSLYKAILANGKAVTKNFDDVNEVFIENFEGISDDDTEAGYIYVLKSLSTNPDLSGIANLYKIGYSKNKVPERIKNAEKEPTYLMAEVKIESAFKCYNINAQKLEQLIHNFFGNSCLEVDVFDENGKRHTPREWFIAPINVIEQAIALIISGDIVKYRYDMENEVIELR